MDEFMEFGLFQLENLFLNPSRFKFFDLRESAGEVRAEILRLLKNAEPVKPGDVRRFLGEQKVPLEFPVVLICEDGDQSKKIARALARDGFQNIYVVAGGVEGLLLEL